MASTMEAEGSELSKPEGQRPSLQVFANSSGRNLLSNVRGSFTRLVQARETAKSSKEQQRQHKEMETNRVRNLLLGQSLWQDDVSVLQTPGMFSVFVESIQYSAPPLGRVQSWIPQSRRPTMHANVILLPPKVSGATDNLVMFLGGDLATASEDDVMLTTAGSSSSIANSITSGGSSSSITADGAAVGALGIVKERRKKNRTRPPVTRRVSASLRNSFRQYTSSRNQVELAWNTPLDSPGDLRWAPIVQVQLVKQTSSTKKEVIGETAVEVGSLFKDASRAGDGQPVEKVMTSPVLLPGVLGKMVGNAHLRIRWTPSPVKTATVATKRAKEKKPKGTAKKGKKVMKKSKTTGASAATKGAAPPASTKKSIKSSAKSVGSSTSSKSKISAKTAASAGSTKSKQTAKSAASRVLKKPLKARAGGGKQKPQKAKAKKKTTAAKPKPNATSDEKPAPTDADAERAIRLGIGKGLSAKPKHIKVVSSATDAVAAAMAKPKVRLATIWREAEKAITKEPEPETKEAVAAVVLPSEEKSAVQTTASANDRWQVQPKVVGQPKASGHRRNQSTAIDALNLEAQGDDGRMRDRVDTKHTTWTDWGPPDPATPVFRDGWTRFLDEKRGIHYWYHDEFGTSWKRPKGWVVSSRSNYADTLESDWIEEFSKKYQKRYWFNTATGESVWVKPAEAP